MLKKKKYLYDTFHLHLELNFQALEHTYIRSCTLNEFFLYT